MTEKWIIPCSPKFFDVVDHFKSRTDIVWRRTSAIRKDDIVYIYVGKPYGEIKYQCRVIDDNISEELLKNNRYAIPQSPAGVPKYVLLKLEYIFPEGVLDYQSLKKHGLTQVQKQVRASKELIEYIDTVETKLFGRG